MSAAQQLAKVPIPARTLVIGDLHLDVEVEASLAPFVAWLDALVDVPRLIVLGDLFEYWVGAAQQNTPGGARVVQALARLAGRGCSIELLPGNRDFLVDERFARAARVQLHRGGLLGELGSSRCVLFLHGDELCTADRAYQRLRRVLRSASVTWLAERLPLAASQAVARRLRQGSRRALAAKPAAVTAQSAQAVLGWLEREQAELLVCGHAHRYKDEGLAPGRRWVVLDAFHSGTGPHEVLEFGAAGLVGWHS